MNLRIIWTVKICLWEKKRLFSSLSMLNFCINIYKRVYLHIVHVLQLHVAVSIPSDSADMYMCNFFSLLLVVTCTAGCSPAGTSAASGSAAGTL